MCALRTLRIWLLRLCPLLGLVVGCDNAQKPVKGTTSSAAVPADQLAAAAKTFIEQLSKGQYTKARSGFDKTMLDGLSEKKLEAIWSGLVAKHGAFKKVMHQTRRMKAPYTAMIATCQFEKGQMGLRVVFDQHQKIAGFFTAAPEPAPGTTAAATAKAKANRPQTPKPPFPYEAREVLYDNPTDKSKLGGTLTLPKGAGPFPAALLITGSGSQDRDETIFEHKPFFVIADFLTRKGFAVLRVDDRGVGKSTGKTDKATIQTHATDVVAGVEFLKKQKQIDPQRIGLIGHSEGGIIAPLVASEHSKDIAFIVSLAGSGIPGAELSALQIELISRDQQKLPAESVKKLVQAQRDVLKVLVEDGDETAVQKVLKSSIEVARKHGPPEARALTDAQVDAAIKAEGGRVASPWFRSFIKLDPTVAWKKVQCPVLVLIGEKDTQVPPDVNIAGIKKALTAGGNKDIRLEKLAGLNHLYQHAKTGFLEEYAQIEETFDPATLDLMGKWLGERMLADKKKK